MTELERAGVRSRIVQAFLRRHSDLLPVAVSALMAGKLQAPDAQLSLEMNPDSLPGHEQLVLYVRKNTYDESILEELDAIASAISEKQAGKSGWILVTTDFRKP